MTHDPTTGTELFPAEHAPYTIRDICWRVPVSREKARYALKKLRADPSTAKTVQSLSDGREQYFDVPAVELILQTIKDAGCRRIAGQRRAE